MAQSNPQPKYRDVSETQLPQNLFNLVLCPNLRTGIRMGLLNPDSQGWVSERELRSFLEYIGLVANSGVETLLVHTAKIAPKEKRTDYINITALKGTFLDHGSESGTLNTVTGFSEDRLELLLSFSNQEGQLRERDLAISNNNFYQCPYHKKSLIGSNILSFEFAGLLHIYGRTDSHGEKYFTRQDVIDLWKHNRFPENWQAPEKQFYGTTNALWNYLKLMCIRFYVGWWNVGRGIKEKLFRPS